MQRDDPPDGPDPDPANRIIFGGIEPENNPTEPADSRNRGVSPGNAVWSPDRWKAADCEQIRRGG